MEPGSRPPSPGRRLRQAWAAGTIAVPGVFNALVARLAETAGQMQWEETAAIIERVLAQEKNLFPNLDWPAGRLFNALGLHASLYTPIFAIARITGWSAHVLEQMDNNRLIRPRARYTGPEVRAVRPLAERK